MEKTARSVQSRDLIIVVMAAHWELSNKCCPIAESHSGVGCFYLHARLGCTRWEAMIVLS